MGRRKMHIGIWWVNVQGTDYLEDLDADGSTGRIILVQERNKWQALVNV
jgi:hypothetical protein